jgi:heme exporter protein D
VFLPQSAVKGRIVERMEGVAKFLAMGGYAAYVWPALGVTAAVLGGLLVVSLKSLHRREAELARLEAESQGDDEA